MAKLDISAYRCTMIPHEWLTEANGDITHVKVDYADLLGLDDELARARREGQRLQAERELLTARVAALELHASELEALLAQIDREAGCI